MGGGADGRRGSPLRAASPAAPPRASCSRLGAPTAGCTTSATAADGGTCYRVDDPDARGGRRRIGEPGERHGARPARRRVRQAGVDLRPADLRLPAPTAASSASSARMASSASPHRSGQPRPAADPCAFTTFWASLVTGRRSSRSSAAARRGRRQSRSRHGRRRARLHPPQQTSRHRPRIPLARRSRSRSRPPTRLDRSRGRSSGRLEDEPRGDDSDPAHRPRPLLSAGEPATAGRRRASGRRSSS